MLYQLFIGALVIIGTVVIQVGFFSSIIFCLSRFSELLMSGNPTIKFILVLCTLILWLVLGLTACAWFWAFVFLQLDVFSTLESALYFSIVSFTTLGYGDITIDETFRILASLSAVNGLIIVGLNTAFLVEALSRIRQSQLEIKKR
jgi:hypothetical protein